jgi:hypothetical protein
MMEMVTVPGTDLAVSRIALGTWAIWGGRRPEQMAPIDDIFGWQIDDDFMTALNEILAETIPDPVDSEFMAPPAR